MSALRAEEIEAGITAELERAASYVRSIPAPRPSAERVTGSPPRMPGGGAGSCTGFVIPDYIIQRESGGQPFVKNPLSDAFGCAQTLLRHYYGGACDGLDPYTIQGQRDCVYRISDGGRNLAPWASTR